MTRFDEAVLFAVQAHSDMHRKGSINPFVLHPMEAAAIAAGVTTDEDVIIAALLHDTIEDAGCSQEVIREKFGGRVLALVLADTETTDPTRPELDTWMERKGAALDFLKHSATRDEKIVILADRLSNLRSIYNDMHTMGDGVWAMFHEQHDKFVQAWYYQSVADEMKEFADTAAYDEYRRLLKKVFAED